MKEFKEAKEQMSWIQQNKLKGVKLTELPMKSTQY